MLNVFLINWNVFFLSYVFPTLQKYIIYFDVIQLKSFTFSWKDSHQFWSIASFNGKLSKNGAFSNDLEGVVVKKSSGPSPGPPFPRFTRTSFQPPPIWRLFRRAWLKIAASLQGTFYHDALLNNFVTEISTNIARENVFDCSVGRTIFTSGLKMSFL